MDIDILFEYIKIIAITSAIAAIAFFGGAGPIATGIVIFIGGIFFIWLLIGDMKERDLAKEIENTRCVCGGELKLDFAFYTTSSYSSSTSHDYSDIDDSPSLSDEQKKTFKKYMLDQWKLRQGHTHTRHEQIRSTRRIVCRKCGSVFRNID
jgi:hypothetical protein